MSDVITRGAEAVYNDIKPRINDFWNYIRYELNRRINAGEPRYGYSKQTLGFLPDGNVAPMLGIRESYRIECDYMLRQSDLAKKIDSNNLQDFIACGSHVIDFHVYGSIDWAEVKKFNDSRLQPSGIPYSCLVPKALDNTLVACRAYGASHIALAARRVNKDMAQLGWAAGQAIRICLEDNIETRQVDIKKLQSGTYTNFYNSVKELEKRMAD